MKVDISAKSKLPSAALFVPIVSFPQASLSKAFGGSCYWCLQSRALVNIPLSEFGSKVISLSNVKCNIGTNVWRSSLL